MVRRLAVTMIALEEFSRNTGKLVELASMETLKIGAGR
jgi:hypothetical protein